MFSPILPTSAARVSSTVRPSAMGSAETAATSAGALSSTSWAIPAARARKSSFLATKSVSQFISTMAPVLPSAEICTATTPSAVMREAALLALLPSLTRRISSARSMSPLASVSAFLHSIIGASVFSRSVLTMLAVISAMSFSLFLFLNSNGTTAGTLKATPAVLDDRPGSVPRRPVVADQASSSVPTSTNSSSSVAALTVSCRRAALPSRMASATPRAYRRTARPESSLPGMT